jgi:hypothetical protein
MTTRRGFLAMLAAIPLAGLAAFRRGGIDWFGMGVGAGKTALGADYVRFSVADPKWSEVRHWCIYDAATGEIIVADTEVDFPPQLGDGQVFEELPVRMRW